jgi:ribosomal protein S18 acetylase RimI-like enzyme
MDRQEPELSAGLRPLGAADLERVIAIDRAHTGYARRRFFEKRFQAAELRREDFIQIGIDRDGTLTGFVLARILRGEFGREEAVAELDSLGVDPASQEHGHGHALLRGLAEAMQASGVRALHSEAEWTNHKLLEFFDSAGFALAPRMTLERRVHEPLAERIEDS